MADDRFSRTGDGRQLRYTDVAIFLHRAIALGILYDLATGLFGECLPSGAFAFRISSGITVLALTVRGLLSLPLVASVSGRGRIADRVPERRALNERIEGVHLAGGWISLAMPFLHVAGALKRRFVDRECEVQRSGVGRRSAA